MVLGCRENTLLYIFLKDRTTGWEAGSADECLLFPALEPQFGTLVLK